MLSVRQQLYRALGKRSQSELRREAYELLSSYEAKDFEVFLTATHPRTDRKGLYIGEGKKRYHGKYYLGLDFSLPACPRFVCVLFNPWNIKRGDEKYGIFQEKD